MKEVRLDGRDETHEETGFVSEVLVKRGACHSGFVHQSVHTEFSVSGSVVDETFDRVPELALKLPGGSWIPPYGELRPVPRAGYLD